jgi:hypothetical protein
MLRVYTHLTPDVADKMRQAIDAAYTQDHPSGGTATAREGRNTL